MRRLELAILTLFIWAVPLIIEAQRKCFPERGQDAPGGPFTRICVPETGGVASILEIVFKTLLGFAGGFAILFLIIGGIRYIVSAGNVDQIESARNTIYNALIGIVVILITFVILNTVFNIINP